VISGDFATVDLRSKLQFLVVPPHRELPYRAEKEVSTFASFSILTLNFCGKAWMANIALRKEMRKLAREMREEASKMRLESESARRKNRD
jgi:hypothetical protein